MTAIDFSRSYMRWFNPANTNSVRILIDAACTLIDDETGQSDTYYLIAPCRAEHTHVDDDLIQMPNYEFCGIWGARDKCYIRTHWASGRDRYEYQHLDKADTLDIRYLSSTRKLTDNDAVFEATMGSSEPLISRTTVRDDRNGTTTVLEYPVKTMNVKEEPVRFQVDTGPLIVPDFGRDAENPIERFDVAHVVYNRFDEAQFILRKPVAGREGTAAEQYTTDYSEIRRVDARNELLLAVSD